MAAMQGRNETPTFVAVNTMHVLGPLYRSVVFPPTVNDNKYVLPVYYYR
jgi:hypothetical protein